MSLEEEKVRLNNLMCEYSVNKAENGNRAASKSALTEAANIMFDSNNSVRKALLLKAKGYILPIYMSCEDLINETITKYFFKYDHSKNDNFYAYFCTMLDLVGKNLFKKVTEENNNSSIDQPVDLEENTLDVCDPHGEDDYEPDPIVIFNSAMIICIIKISKHSKRKQQAKYYRAFAAEFYISHCKDGFYHIHGLNENEAFDVMDVGFIDFVLSSECRTFEKIEKTAFKTYKAAGISEENTKISVPFKAEVFASYLQVSESRISQLKSAFKSEVNGIVTLDEISSR